mmetsp:Transcript_132839/g.370372  ORF Transcript_132839/g.370372 Transcript_132839/m.370372 type:complete len:222 (-) Transcript_132839:336-1001(-)
MAEGLVVAEVVAALERCALPLTLLRGHSHSDVPGVHVDRVIGDALLEAACTRGTGRGRLRARGVLEDQLNKLLPVNLADAGGVGEVLCLDVLVAVTNGQVCIAKAPSLDPSLDHEVERPDAFLLPVCPLTLVVHGFPGVAHEDASASRRHHLKEPVLHLRGRPDLPVGECHSVPHDPRPTPDHGVPTGPIHEVGTLVQPARAYDGQRGLQKTPHVHACIDR